MLIIDPPGAALFMTKMQKLYEVLAALFLAAPGKRKSQSFPCSGDFRHVDGVERESGVKLRKWDTLRCR